MKEKRILILGFQRGGGSYGDGIIFDKSVEIGKRQKANST